MNPRYFKKLIHLLRYGFISLIWSYIAPIIIKVSGPRTAAYLSYKSIDWGEMNHEKTILCLQRESFVKDIIELRKRSSYNYPMIAGGFTRFQMVWFPVEMQIQTFYKLHQKKNNKALTLAAEYATHLILLVSKKHSVQAVLSANFDYWQDAGFKVTCNELNIPFLVLSREHPVIPKVCDEVVNWYKESAYHFEGTAIAVAGHSTKDVIMKVDTICKPEQITITGLPRYDAWLDVDTSMAIEKRPFITLLTFTDGYYADDTFIEVLDLFCKSALEHEHRDVGFFIKTKDADDTHRIQQILGKERFRNIHCEHETALFEILPKSRMIINYNSLSLVEAVMAKARVVIPIWGQCSDHGEEAMYQSANSTTSKVVEFSYGKDALLDMITLSVNGYTREIPNIDVRNFIDEYIHVPNKGTYSDEFDRFVSLYLNLKKKKS